MATRYGLAAIALCLVGCDNASAGSGDNTEDNAARCDDRVDNDGDGAVDCEDAECVAFCVDASDTDTDTNTNVDMERYRVIMSSDFPPTDVCNIMDGCDCPAEKCSDPDDVQSMVRFLLYTNELDVEGLIAAAGTYVMAANKQNILDMLDLFDQVDENLRNHDPQYPTADALRAVTFEGRGVTMV